MPFRIWIDETKKDNPSKAKWETNWTSKTHDVYKDFYTIATANPSCLSPYLVCARKME